MVVNIIMKEIDGVLHLTVDEVMEFLKMNMDTLDYDWGILCKVYDIFDDLSEYAKFYILDKIVIPYDFNSTNWRHRRVLSSLFTRTVEGAHDPNSYPWEHSNWNEYKRYVKLQLLRHQLFEKLKVLLDLVYERKCNPKPLKSRAFDNIEQCCYMIGVMELEITRMKDKITMFETMIKYRPGGEGFKECKKEFYSTANMSLDSI